MGLHFVGKIGKMKQARMKQAVNKKTKSSPEIEEEKWERRQFAMMINN